MDLSSHLFSTLLKVIYQKGFKYVRGGSLVDTALNKKIFGLTNVLLRAVFIEIVVNSRRRMHLCMQDDQNGQKMMVLTSALQLI